MMITCIDTYKDRFGVCPIWRVLASHLLDGFITGRGHRLAKSRPASVRSIRDEQLIERLKMIHAAKFGVLLGVQMWRAMRRVGWLVLAGLGAAGVRSQPRQHRCPIHVLTLSSGVLEPTCPMSCGALISPKFAPGPGLSSLRLSPIAGWSTRSTMRTWALPLEAFDQAISQAKDSLDCLVHPADHGSQYDSIAYGDMLAKHGIASSTGSIGGLLR